VTHHSRQASGEWASEEIADAGTMRLPRPATTLTLDQIYEGVELPPLGVAEELDSRVEDYVTE
jgi:hypothetical protein